MNQTRFTPFLLAIVGIVSCGGEKPEAKTPMSEPQAVAVKPEKTGGPQVSQELGSIDERAVSSTMEHLGGRLESCHQQGRGRVEYLSGDVKIFLRIDTGGHVRYGYFEESTIGDHETEKCFLDAVMNASFPQPDGGEAEVRYTTGIRPSGGRPPNDWGADKVADAITAAMPCKAGASVDFQVTMYVVEGNGKSGKVQAVGVSAPNKDASTKIECIIKAIKDAKVPTPGTWPAKVSFKL